MHYGETNPHFLRPLQQSNRPHHSQPQAQAISDQPQPLDDPPDHPQPQDRHSGPTAVTWASRPESQEPPPRAPRLKKHRQDPYSEVPTATPRRLKSKSEDQHGQQPRPRVQIQDPHLQPSESREPHALQQDHHRPQHHDRRSQENSLRMPLPRQTNPLMWFGAVFCVIFWVLVIVGGLAVLIVYLIFRPKSPRFDIAAATINAAYLDMGYLLNADVNLLANFTNPNKKVSVDFSYMILDLYYGNTLIATQYIKPFSAFKEESMLLNIHMVSSQIRLPLLESQRLQKQIETNGIKLDVKGIFRARSNFGTLLQYSYWLHSYCSFIVGGPPDGVLMRSKCRTKH